MQEFKDELTKLINRHSLENDTNTPDFILAEYLIRCLDAFTVVNLRDEWEGRNYEINAVVDVG